MRCIHTYSCIIFSAFSRVGSINVCSCRLLWSHFSASHLRPLLRDTFIRSSPRNFPTKPCLLKLIHILSNSDNAIASSSIECAATQIVMRVNRFQINSKLIIMYISSGLLSYFYYPHDIFLWRKM